MTTANMLFIALAYALITLLSMWFISLKLGYIWIKRSDYNEAGEYMAYLAKQNDEYKKLLASKEHFPTTAKENTLFNINKVPQVNGQRYNVSFSDGTYSLPYVEYMNYSKGQIKVKRTTYNRQHINAKWSQPTTKTLWIDESDYASQETYNDNKLSCWRDKLVKLDWKKESDNAQYNASQMELIK